MITIEKAKEYYEKAVIASKDARAASEKCRDYYNHQQYSASEISSRTTDGKALVKINKIHGKINRLKGEVISQKTDPRAFPRTPKHEKDADAASDALKYITDNTNFDATAADEAEKEFIEGTFGVLVEVNPNNMEVTVNSVPWDRFFHDPHSRRKDFGDAYYMGIVRWQELEDAKLEYPNKEESFSFDDFSNDSVSGVIDSDAYSSEAGNTFDDKPDHKKYWDGARKRVLTIQLYYLHKQQWHTCIFTEKGFLADPKIIGYKDEFDEPDNPLVMASAYVDRQGQRFGHTYILLDLQDEINHQRNKALDYINKNQTWSRGEALTGEEVKAINTQKEKVNGHIQFPIHGELEKDFGFIPNDALSQVHFNMYMDAKNSIDDVGASDSLQGKDGNSSGRAQLVASQNSLKEMLPDFELHRQWKLRVYRKIWNRVRQFWKEEKWVRVTDNEKVTRHAGLNIPFTQLEAMIAERDGIEPLEVREQYGQELEQAYQQDPRFAEVAGMANNVSELDVDIILDEVPDQINLATEQFDMLSKLADRYGPEKVPFEAILELSSIRNKEKVINMLKGDDSPEAQQAAQQAQAEQQEIQEIAKEKEIGEIEKDASITNKNNAEAEGQAIENSILVNQVQQVVPAQY